MNFRQYSSTQVEINLTPLIDVVFLLLIFFMVSTSFTKETHLKIDLPEAVAEPATQNLDIIELIINSEGNYAINGRELVDTKAATLERALSEFSAQAGKVPFQITGDAQTPHQSVVTAMDVAGRLGFKHISIASQQPSK